MEALGPRGILSLLLHGPKIVDAVETALELGLLRRLDHGPVTLAELARALEVRPLRLYKLLDVLETAGLVARSETPDEYERTSYASTRPLEEAARAVLGPESIERDRDKYPWRALHGRLKDVLRGTVSIAEDAFDWPPRTPEQVAAFEASMAAGMPPIVESMTAALDRHGLTSGRFLDVGGGDGTLAIALSRAFPQLSVDVFNLPLACPLAERKVRETGARVGIVAGDFLARALPSGYDVLAFVRVLHDWPNDVARALLAKAWDSLPAGGSIVVCEELRDRERLAIQLFWSYFLVGVDSCTSRLREVEWYVRALGAIGFEELRIVHGPFDVIVARKPLH